MQEKRKFSAGKKAQKKCPGYPGHFFSKADLLLGGIPGGFADQSGQIAAVGGFAFESVADTIVGGLVGDAFQNFGGNVRFGFDVVKFVIHSFSPYIVGVK